MFSYYKSEVLKMKHTFFFKLILLAPMFPILLTMILIPKYLMIDSYNWWYTTALPGMLSLGCTLVANKELKMKNRAILSLPINLKKVWVAKVLICVSAVFCSCIILFMGSSLLQAILQYNKIGSIPVLSAFAGSLVLAVTFLWQIPLCLFLGYKIGMFPTILINFSGYLILGIIASVENYWWLVPYAIPSRLMCPIIKVLPNGLPAVEGSQTFTQSLLSYNVIVPGLLISIVLFIILTVITTKWFEKREAK